MISCKCYISIEAEFALLKQMRDVPKLELPLTLTHQENEKMNLVLANINALVTKVNSIQSDDI